MMVQKEAQYHYIYKCLADFIASQELEYVEYENDYWNTNANTLAVVTNYDTQNIVS